MPGVRGTAKLGDALTDKERRVWTLKLEGLSDAAVAERLCISVPAVSYLCRRAASKLGQPRPYRVKHRAYSEPVTATEAEEAIMPRLPKEAVEREEAKAAFVTLAKRCWHCGGRNLYVDEDGFGSRLVCLQCGRAAEA